MSDISVSIGQRYESDSLVIFGINNNEKLELIEIFTAAFGITFPVLLDSAFLVVSAYNQFGGISPFPLDYIIDQQMKVAYHNTDYDPRRMIEIINNLLNITGVERSITSTPLSYRLKQNYPNPFNPATQIEFSLPVSSKVSLVIYNLLGQEIARLIDGEQAAGVHSVTWEATNLATGIYFYRIQAGDFVQTRKMLLLK